MPGIKRDERERYDLECGEEGTQGHVETGLAAPIPMMPGTDKPAGEIENGIEVNDARCRKTRDGTELEEDDRHHDGHEEFKKSFDPEVDDPESPGVNHREMGRAVEEHRRQIKNRDRARRAQK